MGFEQELILLFVGATIAWISGILTAIFTTILNQWVSQRASLAKKRERLYHLTGRLAALAHTQPSDVIKEWLIEKAALDEIIRKSGESDLDGLIGSTEGFLDKTELHAQIPRTELDK